MKQLLITSLLLASSLAFADDIRLGEPSYGGSGCPAGSASAVLSPDANELSVLFDQYIVEAGGNTGKTVDRKSCNLAIPVHVPQGLSVSILKVDYRGYNMLPSGASSQLSAEYFFAGGRGPKTIRDFRGSLDSEYTVSDSLVATALVWSRCGESVNLRVNSAMQVRTNARRQQAMATVDSTDVDAKIIYKLQWKSCR